MHFKKKYKNVYNIVLDLKVRKGISSENRVNTLLLKYINSPLFNVSKQYIFVIFDVRKTHKFKQKLKQIPRSKKDSQHTQVKTANDFYTFNILDISKNNIN